MSDEIELKIQNKALNDPFVIKYNGGPIGIADATEGEASFEYENSDGIASIKIKAHDLEDLANRMKMYASILESVATAARGLHK